MCEDDAFDGGGVILECPRCAAEVSYEAVLPTDAEGMSQCPECEEIIPTEEWFE